jgi:hypothetical protein
MSALTTLFKTRIALLPARLAVVALTFWVGGLWVIGYLVVPSLFANLPEQRVLAGVLAGKLFATIGGTGVVVATSLLLYGLWLNRAAGLACLKKAWCWLLLLALLLIWLNQFTLQPWMNELKAVAAAAGHEVLSGETRAAFVRGHGASSVLYLLQSLIGMALLLVYPAMLQNRTAAACVATNPATCTAG